MLLVVASRESHFFPLGQKYLFNVSKVKRIKSFLHSGHLFRFFLMFPDSTHDRLQHNT